MKKLLTLMVGAGLLWYGQDSALAQAKKPGIPVVKTWKELQEAPAIDIGGGVKIHLGLEANKVPQWSGGLIYCLTEGYTPADKGSNQEPFGPVHLDFRLATNDREEKHLMRWVSGKKVWPKGSYLFVRDLAVDQPGSYRIRVRNAKGDILAEQALEGTKEIFHPWMPWVENYENLTMVAVGISLPSTPLFGPRDFLEPGKSRANELPTLLPAKETKGFTLSREGNEYVLRSDKEFVTSRPDYHFLARWWVNDKPFVPKQLAQERLHAGYGAVHSKKELRLKIPFDAKILGAKPGDRIGLQLLYCAAEWKYCLHGARHKLGGEGDAVWLSNRIDFVP